VNLPSGYQASFPQCADYDGAGTGCTLNPDGERVGWGTPEGADLASLRQGSRAFIAAGWQAGGWAVWAGWLGGCQP